MAPASHDIKTVFGQAMDIGAGQDRSRFLDRACADNPGLRAEVEGLLEAIDQAGTFLAARPPVGPASGGVGPCSNGRLAAGLPQRIGRYKLLEQIGEGGMGIVYVAEQTELVRRRVALKIIKPGMDSRACLARFEAERQVLAMMDHPNIAKFFDAGTVGEEARDPESGVRGEEVEEATVSARPVTAGIGRPYFVMELVRGMPITEYCDQARLEPRKRLELFITVCHAVQHAHHKGIIHRDLKPSNILVTLHDGVPVPKIIDFGIAKALNQQLADRTVYTAFAQLVGTPLYMSPEQAELSGLDVDTRSDVYSLGVLLYELLTGSTPFDKEVLKKFGLDEMRRRIREEEPLRPSARISTLAAAALSAVPHNRGLDQRRLGQLLRGELDWIVMKALEKDRTRRYESASSLALDLQHYLNDEPVLACPPSAGYLLRKFGRRYRKALTTTALVMLALLLGTIVSSYQAIRATRAEALARTNAEAARAATVQALALAAAEAKARRQAQTAAAAEEEARKQAEAAALAERQSRQQAEAATEAERLATRSARERELETKAVLDFLESSILAAARPEGQDGGLGKDISLRQAIERAVAFVDESFLDQPLIEARLRMTLGLSFQYLGDAKRSEEQYRAAFAINATQRGPTHPDTLKSMAGLAHSYYRLGRRDEALTLREKVLGLCTTELGLDHAGTLSAMQDLAVSYSAAGRHEEAVELCEQTLALRKSALGPNHPDTLSSMADLAVAYAILGRYQEALELREQTLALREAELGRNHPDTLGSWNELASSYYDLRRYEEAAKLYEQTVELRRAKLGPDHPGTLTSMAGLADSYYALGRHEQALELRKQTLELRRSKLGPEHQDTLRSMAGLANSYAALGRHREAMELREATWALQRAKLGPEHPNTVRTMAGLADSYYRVGRHEEALAMRRQTLHLTQTKLGAEHPDTLRAMHRLADSCYELGQQEEAQSLYSEVLALRRSRFGPDHSDTLRSMAGLANTYAALGRHEEAWKLRVETLELRTAKLGPDHPDTLSSMWLVARSLTELHRSGEALPLIDDCLKRAAGKAVDARLIPSVCELRLRHFQKLNDAAGCRETAEIWERLNRTDAGGLVDAARYRAVTAAVMKTGESTESARRESAAQSARAVEWLKRAIAAGYRDVARLKEDADLDVLREREDFGQLVAELEGDRQSGAP